MMAKSFAETHPRNSNATCKCEHWQSCIDCHPTAHSERYITDAMKVRQAVSNAVLQESKDGSPCAEFWDWLPKAYNFDGNGSFTKYNMEVAFLAGKQSQPQQEPVEYQYRTRPDWIPEWNGWNTCSKESAEAYEKNPYLHDWHYEVRRLYTTPPQRKPLTNEEIYDMYNEPRSDAEMLDFARAIEAKLKEKNNA